MMLTNMPERTIDWSLIPAKKVHGASSFFSGRAHQSGDVQQRIVEYAPGYLADHWCSKGHIIYVLTGALTIEHESEEPACALLAGMSWQVADGEGAAHRVRCENGATVFIVD